VSFIYSAIGIETGYGGIGVQVPIGARFFSFPRRLDRFWGLHTASYPVGVGMGGSSLEVKRPGREADHLPPTRAEVQGYVDVYIHCPIRLHGVMLN
jgi:cytolysin (calcineurin-like family phosphatase)